MADLKTREWTPVPAPIWPQQSPIDLREPTYHVSNLDTLLQFNYQQPVKGTLGDDHEVHLDADSPAHVLFDGVSCPLIKLHFHRPSEHLVDGIPAFMEVHLVHEIPTSAGMPSEKVVVAVFIDDARNATSVQRDTKGLHIVKRLSAFASHVFNKGTDHRFDEIHLQDLLPNTDQQKDFWHYEGSLTTPGFDEYVSWIVLHEHATLDEQTSKELAEHPKSARPVQPLSRRFVLRSFPLPGEVVPAQKPG